MVVDHLHPPCPPPPSGDARLGRWKGTRFEAFRRSPTDNNQVCRPTFPLQIAVDAPFLQESEAQHLVRTTQHALDDLNEFSAHHLRLTLSDPMLDPASTTAQPRASAQASEDPITQGDSVLTVRLTPVEGNQAVRVQLHPYSSMLEVFYAPNHVPSASSSSSTLASSIANKLQEMFLEEQATMAYILSSAPGSGQGSSPTPAQGSHANAAPSGLSRILTPEFVEKLSRRTTRSLKYAPTYHITISLFTPGATPSSWEIESALHDDFLPLLQSFNISEFTVDSQVQLYASFSPSVQEPEFDSAAKVWTLRDEDLSGFINAAEWPLAPSIGAGPTLNFILYVPDQSKTPLVVKSSHASSWLIPQWGGVTILNPPAAAKAPGATLSKDQIEPALLTFSHQLLSLLGAPDTPPSLPLQFNSMTRVQAASLLLSASSTLGSLARMTVSLPSIPVPENVALGVDKVLHQLQETCSRLRDGQFSTALEHARIAEAEAEKAFFEKSMVGQVYFPDEHKVAVYLPLLGPTGVPLITSLIRELKRLRLQYRAGR